MYKVPLLAAVQNSTYCKQKVTRLSSLNSLANVVIIFKSIHIKFHISLLPSMIE